MKKIFTFLTLLLCLQFGTAQAQQNIYVWNKGSLSVMNTSQVDSLTFSVGSWLYNIACSTPVGITTQSAKVIVSVSLGENVKSITVSPEIGVCFSEDSQLPTIQDHKVSLGSGMTDYTATMDGCYSGTKYHYRAYVRLLGETFYSDVYSFTTLGKNNQPSYVTVNGHKFVDLGLPSGLKWATCNVGANAPEADGDYFAWGETVSKSYYSWATYKWSANGSSSDFSKYANSSKTTLDAEDDAATQNWGEGCRMPTVDEFQELMNNCNRTWISMYGVYGYKFTSKTNGNYIFLPAVGFRNDDDLCGRGSDGSYWSSSLHPNSDYYACCQIFFSGYCDFGYSGRCSGLSVRAVCQ